MALKPIDDIHCIDCGEELKDEDELVSQVCDDCFKKRLADDYVMQEGLDESDEDGFTSIEFLICVMILITLAGVGGMGYLLCHFVAKYW